MSNKGYEKITTGHADDDTESSHPTTSANLFSLLSFWWMNSVFKIGSKRPLKQSDFLPLHEKDRTRDLTERLQKEWNNHVQECNMTEGKQPKLWKCVLKTVTFHDICLPMCFWLLESMFRVSQPLVLGFLLHLLGSAEKNRSLAYACCVFLTLSGLTSACTHYSAYSCDLLGMRLSSAIKGIVYLKVRNEKYDWSYVIQVWRSLTEFYRNFLYSSSRTMPLSCATFAYSSQRGIVINMSTTSRLGLVNRFSFGNT